MRISDWSSDVCSSDLDRGTVTMPEMLRYSTAMAIHRLVAGDADARHQRRLGFNHRPAFRGEDAGRSRPLGDDRAPLHRLSRAVVGRAQAGTARLAGAGAADRTEFRALDPEDQRESAWWEKRW